MGKNDDARTAAEAADATGMVANQELLATFPAEELRSALPSSHGAHASIDELRAELGKKPPSRAALTRHVGALRSVHELEATIANWWDSPEVQQIIMDLTQIGL
jgi:hypothetical protein